MKRIFTILVLCIMAFAASAKNYEVSISSCKFIYDDHYECHRGSVDVTSQIGADVMLEEGDIVTVSMEGTFSVGMSEIYFLILDQSEEANWWHELSSWEDKITVETMEVNSSVDVKITKASLGRGRLFVQMDCKAQSSTQETIIFGDSDASAKTYEVWLPSYMSDENYCDVTKQIGADVLLKEGDIVTVLIDGTFSAVMSGIVIDIVYGDWNFMGAWSYVSLGSMKVNTAVNIEITRDLSGSENLYLCIARSNEDDDENLSSFISNWDSDGTFVYEDAEKTILRKYIGNKSEVIIPSGVSSIGEAAFSSCSGLTSVTIPSSVTSIGNNAFSWCIGLTSITIPNSVTSVGSEAFYECSGLTSVTIPNSVTSIGYAAFSYCSGLTSVTIPNSVTSIENRAFYGCSGLTSVTIPNSVTSIGSSAFKGVHYVIYSGSAEGSPWGAKVVYEVIDENFYYKDAEKTIISVYIGHGGDVVIPNCVTAIEEDAFGIYYDVDVRSIITSITIPNGLDVSNAGISFVKDGIHYNVINNNEVSVGYAESSLTDINIPSTITAGNTFTVTSIDDYAFSRSTISSIVVPENLDISNASIRIEKDGIYYNVISNDEVSVDRAESSLTEVNIPNMITAGMTFAVTEIEEYAFSDCSNLKSVSIPSGVTKVEDGAFSGCTALKNVTCLATVPPTAYANSFENYNGYLSIPCESKDDYDFASCWGSFKHVECIGAEPVELTKDEVAVVPEKTEAVFSMPKNESANSYTLTISNNGVTFCSLTFNAQGQLANIDFSTNKSYELKSGVEAFQFTVTGLSTAEDYGYSFKALASNKSVLKEYAGSFTTKNEDGTGGSVQGGGEGSGQGSQGGEGGEGGSTAVSEVSNTTAITIVNGQILVNGEAPAFVVTVSGQKIANASLKAGVYFVVADGETVGVSVR